MMRIRTYLFYVLWVLATLCWACFIILMVVLPYRWRHRIATGWGDTTVWLARWICGIKWEVHGRENLGKDAAIAMVSHQSTWETVFMPLLVRDQVWVLKKELVRLPIYGWAMALLRPIAIDRSKRKKAMEQVIEQGRQRIDYGFWVVMFPEGTRSAAETPKPFKHGAARLAEALNVPVIPVAHNAGLFWPRRGTMHPGTVQVHIGQAIDTTGLSMLEINDLAEKWITEVRGQCVEAELARRKNER